MRNINICKSCDHFENYIEKLGMCFCSLLDLECETDETWKSMTLVNAGGVKCSFAHEHEHPTMTRKVVVCDQCQQFSHGIHLKGSKTPTKYVCLADPNNNYVQKNVYVKLMVPQACEMYMEQIVMNGEKNAKH